MDIKLKIEWIAHETSSKRAKIKTFYYTAVVGGLLARDLACIDQTSKKFKTWCFLPGVTQGKVLYPTLEKAKEHLEQLIHEWFQKVLYGATIKDLGGTNADSLSDVQRHEEDPDSGIETRL